MIQEGEMAAEAVVASYEDQVQDFAPTAPGDHQEVASYDETAKLVAEQEGDPRKQRLLAWKLTWQ